MLWRRYYAVLKPDKSDHRLENDLEPTQEPSQTSPLETPDRGSINTQDSFGNTPLHYAAFAGNASVVKLCMELPNADPIIPNKDGETAFDYASTHRKCSLAILEARPNVASTVQRWKRK